jgi:hypothetical protein
MKSAVECHARAVECERLAKTAISISDGARHAMMALAEQWRKLAEEAEKRRALSA